eukprot:735436-Pelagomonas_calceolata.AAC.1
MDIMLTGEDQSQADQQNTLAEGPPPCKSKSKRNLIKLGLTRQKAKASVSQLNCHVLVTPVSCVSCAENTRTCSLIFLRVYKGLQWWPTARDSG